MPACLNRTVLSGLVEMWILPKARSHCGLLSHILHQQLPFHVFPSQELCLSGWQKSVLSAASGLDQRRGEKLSCLVASVVAVNNRLYYLRADLYIHSKVSKGKRFPGPTSHFHSLSHQSGVFVTVGWVYISTHFTQLSFMLGFIFDVVYHMGLYKYLIMCIHHCSLYIFIFLQIRCSAYFSDFPPKNHWSFTNIQFAEKLF